MKYLTDEDYRTAEMNGIKQSTAYMRVYTYNWTIEKSITKKPPGKEPERQKWRKVAISNGIDTRLFNERVTDGWSLEKAATTQALTKEESIQKANDTKPSVFTREQILLASANGIKYGTALARYNRGWSTDDAVTAPTGSRRRR